MNIEKTLDILSAQVEHDLAQEKKGFRDWILQQDIDWFGRLVPAGTVYKQVNADYYHPMLNGAQCPHLQVSFMIVKCNERYFLPKKRFNEP